MPTNLNSMAVVATQQDEDKVMANIDNNNNAPYQLPDLRMPQNSREI
jgi:hypothetical protein